MIEQAIEKIAKMTAPVVQDIDDRMYSNKPLYPVIEPVPVTITVATLTGIKDYIVSNFDCLTLSELTIHVKSHDHVEMLSTLISPFEQRKTYIQAIAMTPQILFERPLDVEPFIIQLQRMFVKTLERDSLLKFIGGLKAGFSKTISDNGISQTVTAKTGITTVGEAPVPNPVKLKPYRTFMEIDQPESDFVFRIHGGEGEPTCALYDADGGAWKLTAIKRIAEWIKFALPNMDVIA